MSEESSLHKATCMATLCQTKLSHCCFILMKCFVVVFQYVVVITCQGSAVHTFSRSSITEENEDFFSQVEDRLLEWMGNMVRTDC